MMGNRKITDSIYLIDADVFGIPNFTSAYLVVGEELALIETGPTKSVPTILEGIRGVGFDPSELSYLVVTHIHLDHAGGAGALIKEMPKAKVVVHQNGARHMIDPSKLVSSAKRVFGNRIDAWYGEVLPVAQERIMTVEGGNIIDLGKGCRLRMINSPGHAVHHICVYSEKDAGLFTGDAVGVYFPHSRTLIPTTPPPEFDPDVNIETIKGLRNFDPNLILFSHFGPCREVEQIVHTSIDRLRGWKDTVSRMMRENASVEKITERLMEDTKKVMATGKTPESLYRWIMEHHIPMCAAGYVHYCKKKLPPS